MSVNAPTGPNTQGVNANTQVGGNVVTGFGPPPPKSNIPIPQVPAETQQFVQQQAPRAQTFSGPLTPSVTHTRIGEAVPQLFSSYGRPAPAPSIASQFYNWTQRVAQQGADIAAIPGNILLQIGVDTVKDVYRTGEYTSKVLMSSADQVSAQFTEWDLNNRKDNLVKDYKSGKINGTQYKQAMHELSDDYINNQRHYKALDTQINKDSKTLAYNAAQTAILILTLDSSGIAKGFSKFAAGEGADTAMARGVTKLLGERAGTYFVDGGATVSKLITKVPAFGKIIEDAVGTDVLQASPSIYAQSRSAAAAIFIKKPLLYNANITQAKDVYDRIAEGDYGHALIGIGVLGAQALGGGPFGYAREKLGLATTKLGELTFGTGSFMDEFSSRFANGDRAALFNELAKLKESNPEKYANYIQRFKEIEHLNMTATGGRAVEAVDRVMTSLESAGHDLSTMSALEGAENGINWAEGARQVLEDAKAGKIKGISPIDANKLTVAPFDIANRNKLAQVLIKVDKNLTTATSLSGVGKVSKTEGGFSKAELALMEKQGITPELLSKGKVIDSTGATVATSKPTATKLTPITMADKIAARRAAIQEIANNNPNLYWTNSVNTMNKIDKIITTVENTKQMAREIRAITAQRELEGLSEATQKFLTKRGLALIRPISKEANFVPFEETSKVLHTNFAQESEGIFQKAVQPVPVLSHIGAAIERLGISPRDASTLVSELRNANLAENLDSLKLKGKFRNITNGTLASDNIINRLEVFARSRRVPVTDLRQLSIKDIGKVLKINEEEAKQVGAALNDAMLRIPLQYRGAGDRLLDYNLKYNPLAGGYARLQGALRYAWNPFFKLKLDTKTEVFSQLETGGKQISYPLINKFNDLVFPGKSAELNRISGILKDSRILTTGYGGEGAQDLVVGQIGARLTKAQTRSLAGVVDAMATTQGKTVEQLLADNPQQITDQLRILVQYPKTGFVNSPLARTLNTVFFPARFNIKVAELSAKALAKQSPYMQVAIIKGMYNFNAWLKTDEGTAWQSTHSDVLGILEYLSPLHTLTQTLANLQGHAESVGDLGELGGLPFGIISQMLSSQGIIPNLNTPYVNPKTGDVIPKYVPQTTKARLSTAIQDLLTSVFTYPGQTFGLPGKASTVRKATNAALGVKGKEYKQIDQTDKLTPTQFHESRVIKELPTDHPLGAPAYSSASDIYHTPTLSPSSGIAAPITRGKKVPTLTKSEIRALKKSTARTKTKKLASGVPSR